MTMATAAVITKSNNKVYRLHTAYVRRDAQAELRNGGKMSVVLVFTLLPLAQGPPHPHGRAVANVKKARQKSTVRLFHMAAGVVKKNEKRSSYTTLRKRHNEYLGNAKYSREKEEEWRDEE